MNDHLKTYQHLILILAFSVITAASCLGTFFKWDFYQTQGENRKLASYPTKDTPIEAQPKAYEAWFNDHFGFRNTYLKQYSQLMRDLGTDDRVIYGEGEWLFYNRDSMIKDFLGYRQPTEEELKLRVERLKARHDQLKQLGIPYLLVLTPNKATVYDAYLPEAIRQAKGTSYRQRFLAYIKQHAPECETYVLDLLPILQAAKRSNPERQLYYPTDTHWNTFGAQIADQAITEKLQALKPDLPSSFTEDQLEIRTFDFEGDTTRMTATPEAFTIKTEDYVFPKNSWTKKEMDMSLFENHVVAPASYRATHTIHNPDGKYNAIVFHDSFTRALWSYLPHHFKNTTFIWCYSNQDNLELLLKKTRPDFIIEQAVERFFIEEKRGVLINDVNLKAAEVSEDG